VLEFKPGTSVTLLTNKTKLSHRRGVGAGVKAACCVGKDRQDYSIAGGVAFGVSKLPLDDLVIPALFMQQCRSHAAEAVAVISTFL
jgi:hypothetical protein